MENLSKWNVARKYEKRSLLILINCVAALSIFFFGYDQGVMGGVNTNRDYATTMGFGHYDEAGEIVVVDKSLLQGGIVRFTSRPSLRNWQSNKQMCKPDRRLLPTRHFVWRIPWRMVR